MHYAALKNKHDSVRNLIALRGDLSLLTKVLLFDRNPNLLLVKLFRFFYNVCVARALFLWTFGAASSYLSCHNSSSGWSIGCAHGGARKQRSAAGLSGLRARHGRRFVGPGFCAHSSIILFLFVLTKNIDTLHRIIAKLLPTISFIQAGWSTVHVACHFNSVAMVERLIALGADPLVVATGVWPSDNNSSWVVAICHTCMCFLSVARFYL
jgi:hypothetical protein